MDEEEDDTTRGRSWPDCFDCIYVNVQYDMWLKCMLRGIEFPPALGEECG